MTHNPPYHLWIDRPDASEKIDSLLADSLITAHEASLLHQFREEGYFVLSDAIDKTLIDRFREELLELHNDRKKYLVREPRPQKNKIVTIHPHNAVLPPYSRLLDIYVNNKHARDMILSSCLTRMLRLLYSEPPLVFQSLLFTWGTQHELHTDNAFIVADPPCAIISSWIALEDIQEGSGELAFYPESHKDPLFLFSDDNIAWMKQRDGIEAKRQYVDHLNTIATKRESSKKTFLGKKGDVIIWHANLLHYGTKIIHQDKTRYSLLTHYCPHSGTPNYFNFFSNAHKREWNDGYYASRRYDLRPGVDDPYPVFKG
jgi:ectoine hydroxylase-related dioxygenase (phytanoyl-CoA dioxygenase family)